MRYGWATSALALSLSGAASASAAPATPTVGTASGSAAAGSSGTAAAAESATDDRPVVVVVDPGTSGVSPAAVRKAIAEELRTQVLSLGAEGALLARGVLVVGSGDGSSLTLTYRDEKGGQIARTITLPKKSFEVIATIALLAGNLVRDQATSLIPKAAGTGASAGAGAGASAGASADVSVGGVQASGAVGVSIGAKVVASPASTMPPPPPFDGPAAAIEPWRPSHDKESPKKSVEARMLTDRWSLMLLGGTSSGSKQGMSDVTGGAIELQASKRLGWLSLGLMAGIVSGSVRGTGVTGGNFFGAPLAGTVEARIPVGPLLLELGGAFGHAMYTVSSTSASDSSTTTSSRYTYPNGGRSHDDGWTPYGRLMATIGWGMTDDFDLVTRIHWSTTFREIANQGQAVAPLDAASWGLMVGVRGHLR